MGAIDIAISSLRSRRMRSRILPEGEIVKSIGKVLEKGNLLESAGNLVKGIFGKLKNAGGFLLNKVLPAIGFTASAVWGVVSNSVLFLWNFNWNETDQNFDKMLEGLRVRIASQLGETLGNLAGYLACGLLPSAAIFTVNEALGLYLLKEVGEEALDEFVGNLRALINVSFQAAIQAILIVSYKNIRKTIKQIFANPNSGQSKIAKRIFRLRFNKAVESWGTEGSQPWSFASKLEESIDKIKSPTLRAFTEEFFEEFGDACIEAGYVVAGGIDSWVLQQRLARETQFGRERAVEIIPDRETINTKNVSEFGRGEAIILKGKEELIKPAIIQTMATHQLIYNRDMGMIIAQEATEVIAKLTQERQLNIIFKSKEKPPWRMPNGDTAKSTQVTVRHCKKGLKWKDIKLAAKPYNWGRFKAEALMSDGQKMFVYGATSEEAVAKFKELVELSTLSCRAINVIEEVERNKAIKKELTKVYPASCTLLVKRISNDLTGKLDIDGRRWKEIPVKIDLWVDEEPPQFKGALDNLLGE